MQRIDAHAQSYLALLTISKEGDSQELKDSLQTYRAKSVSRKLKRIASEK